MAFGGGHICANSYDMNVRILLFLKCVGLQNYEAHELRKSNYEIEETSDFNKELELLLFDM